MQRIFILLFLFLIARCCSAQSVGIGTTSPNSSAQLDISSKSRGLLIPRMDSAAITAISNPAKGLMIYDSTRNQLLVNMGTSSTPNWQNLVAASGWSLSGNTGTNPGSQFIGTTDAQDIAFRVNNVPAGRLNWSFSERNSFLGYNSGAANTGAGNTGFGYIALQSNTYGQGNTAIGDKALNANTSGLNNDAVGEYALSSNTTGNLNDAVGHDALGSNTTGGANVAMGFDALANNSTGLSNTAIGLQAAFNNSSGSYDVAIGESALSLTTGSNYNTVVGYNSGAKYDNGYNNTFVGANDDVTGAGYYNVIAIGESVTCTANSQARIGNSATNSIGGYAGWTNFSDVRYKKNINEGVKGLDFIMRLRPITYNLDVTGIRSHLHQSAPKDEGTRRSIAERETTLFSGFAAQEVEQAAAAAGYDFSGVDKPKNANDFYGLRYGDFVVPLVKGMQEQQKMIETLEQKVAALEEQNRLLTQLINKKQ